VENENLGILILAPITNKSEQEVAVTFLDEMDFKIDGEECKNKIQQILARYT